MTPMLKHWSFRREKNYEPTAYPARVPFRGFDEEHSSFGN